MKQKLFLYRSLLLLIVLVAILALPASPVGAQDLPILAVDPSQVNIPLGDQFMVELAVTDGVDVNAFDIRLTYDQQRLSLRSWAHGDYLSALSCLSEIKSPGLLELDCTQLGQGEVDGDGVLLELIFDTLALGTADITLEEVIFADSRGVQSRPGLADGVVNVQNLPTYTPTFTRTPTTSFTNTATFTPTSTEVPVQATSPPIPNQPTATGFPTMTATFTPLAAQETPTFAGTTTKTLTTPISGVAEPSRRTFTPTTAFQVTGTMASEGTGTPVGQVPAATIPAEEEDLPVSDGTEGNGELEQDGVGSAFWNYLLLSVLSLSLAALVVMIIIIIRRRANKDEDLLL